MRNNALKESISKLKLGTLVTEFEPLPKQQPFFDSFAKYKEILFLAGNDCGKSYCGAQAVAHFIVPERDVMGQKTGYAMIRRFGKNLQIPPGGVRGWISCFSKKVQSGQVQELVDKIVGPYVTSQEKHGGVSNWLETEGGRIDFKWQEMDVSSYTSDKLHFAWLDEPHNPAIYDETSSRMNKWGGSLWNTLTPARKKDDDNAMVIRNLMWLRETKVVPWHKNPKSRPLLNIVYMSIKDSPYHDYKEISDRNAGMDEMERMAREEGMLIVYKEGAALNHEMIRKLKDHLQDQQGAHLPDYGYLEYDPTETNMDFRVKFDSAHISDYPDKPQFDDKFIVKIWEHPIKMQLDYRPTYYMGVDAAEGKKGGDYSCIYIKRGDTGQIVASLHGYLDEVELAKQIWLLGHYYCDVEFFPCLVAIETLKEGTTAMMYLQTGVDTYGVNFPPYQWDKLYREPVIDDLKAGIHIPSDNLGYHTGPGKRVFLITEMRLYLYKAYRQLEDQGFVLIPDIAWLEEAEFFIRDKSGREGAAIGQHDDRLFASSLCDLAMKQGNFTFASPEPENKGIWSIKDGAILMNILNAQPKVEQRRAYI